MMRVACGRVVCVVGLVVWTLGVKTWIIFLAVWLSVSVVLQPIAGSHARRLGGGARGQTAVGELRWRVVLRPRHRRFHLSNVGRERRHRHVRHRWLTALV